MPAAMATWAIGDVHGCYRSLRRLLRRRAMSRSDRLWFVGDLVNRGPRSLETLRYVADLGERATVVLGNHDLHYLARAAGVGEERKRDTLDRLLAARDGDALAAWLRARPLVVRHGSSVLLHAGVLASWTLREIDRRARQCERALRGADSAAYLRAYRPRGTAAELPQAVDREVLEDLRVLTLLRSVTAGGEPRYDFTGPPDQLPSGRLAWHELPKRKSAAATIVCGHWAAQGLLLRQGLVALDTGCAWGGALTAIRLGDCRVEQTGNVD
jgi:bis(5'-nucleosyl)-tetraphosphatase (symmetrical)